MRWMAAFAIPLAVAALPAVARPMMVTPGLNAPRGVFTRVGPSVKAHKRGDGLVNGGRLLASECAPPKGWCKVILPDRMEAFASAEFLTVVGDKFDFRVSFVDVGGGQAAVLTSGRSEIIIDGGRSPRALVRYLKRKELLRHPVALVIITNPEADHWRGIQTLFRARAPISELWESGYTPTCTVVPGLKGFCRAFNHLERTRICSPATSCSDLAQSLATKRPLYLPAAPEFGITLLTANSNPDQSRLCSYRIGGCSIVVKVEVAGATFLFASDIIGKETDDNENTGLAYDEAALIKNYARYLRANVLVAPNHGYETSSTMQFIKAVNPKFVILSADPERPAADSVRRRYEERPATVLVTYEHPSTTTGDIECKLDMDQQVICAHERLEPR